MHVELLESAFPVALISDCVKSFALRVPSGVPLPPHQPKIKTSINNGILALRERYLPTRFSLDDEVLVDGGRAVRPTLRTLFISGRLELTTLRTIRNMARAEMFIGKLFSWLSSQLSLVHVSPPREICGLATLQSLYYA
jgi:hypothetical protein